MTRTQHLWLDGQHHDLGVAHRLHVGVHDLQAVAPGEDLAALGARVRGDQALGRNQPFGEQAGNHRFGHHPGTHDADLHAAHRASFSSPRKSRAARTSCSGAPQRSSRSTAICARRRAVVTLPRSSSARPSPSAASPSSRSAPMSRASLIASA